MGRDEPDLSARGVWEKAAHTGGRRSVAGGSPPCRMAGDQHMGVDSDEELGDYMLGDASTKGEQYAYNRTDIGDSDSTQRTWS